MKIPSSDLINLPVETQSQDYLGRVDSFEIDTDSGKIVKYFVKTGLIKGLWHEKLAIDQSQVISISKEKMVVKDNLASQKTPELKFAPSVK